MSSPPRFLPRPKGACLAALLTLAALLATAPSGATAAEGPGALWQRCDGGVEDLSCLIPRGIAVNPTSGNVYVADQQNSRIVELTAWGEFLRAWGWGVSDGSAELQVCTSAATCHTGIAGGGRGELTSPQGIAIDSAGNVYVAEGDVSKNRRVQKFDSEGHFILMFGGKVNKTKVEEGKPEAQQNLCPVDPGDVCQTATEGNGNGQFGPWVAGSFIAAGPSPANLLYVGDKGRIQVFNPNGSYKENFPDPEGIISSGGSVQSLAPAPGKGLFLVSNGKADVIRLTAEGKKSCTVNEVNPGAKLVNPSALAIATTATGVPTGNLYVFDEASTSRQARQFSTACADKEAPFAKGEISSSTGMAAGLACSTGAKNPEIYLSNSEFSNSYVRAYGTAPDNTALCPKPVFAPEVVTEFAVSAGTTEAQLRAQINPRFQTGTEYFVQYGTAVCLEGGFEAECVEEKPVPPAALGAPAADVPFTTAGVFLTGLEPGTAYRYRFVATSSGGGPVFGAERSFTTFALPAGGSCPNEAFRTGASAALPDCRAYEMVSPVDKEGGDIVVELDLSRRKAQRDQSSDTGGRFTYSAFRAFGDAETAPFTSQYLAERTPGGWSSHDISPPRGVGFANEVAASTLAGYSEYQAFSADLCSAWLTANSGTAPPLAPGAEPFNFNVYRRSNCGAGADGYEALSRVEVAITFAPLQGLSADEGTVVFRNTAHLTQDVAIPASSPEANKLACRSPVPQKGVSRQWLRDGAPIAGATSIQYTVNKATDPGHTIQCRLTAGEGGTGSTQVANPAWVIAPYPATAPPQAPAHIPAPSASAPLEVGGAGGQTLSCDPGAWEGTPSFAYRWYLNGMLIAGAEAAEYTVQSADLATAATFQCEAVATNAGGTVTETSDVLETNPAPKAPVARPYMAFAGVAQVLYAGGIGGRPRAVCVLPGGVQSDGCTAGMAGGGLSDGSKDQVGGAVAADGSRVFWTDAEVGPGRIYARDNPTAPQSALAHGEATGTGKRTSGSAAVEEVSTASGAFAVGQGVSGEGLPFGTTILAVGAGTLTLSANATKSTAASASLAATSECTEAAKACTVGVSEAVEGAGSGSRFWAASPDGGEVLFATGPLFTEQEQDLYLLDVDTQTPTLIAHRALGVVGESKDLSRIYFISTEALSGGEENSEGAVAQEGRPNLYLRREGGPLSFIATLSDADGKYVETQNRLSPGNVEPYLHGARVSPDGESAAFVSTADPTGYDNTDIASEQPDAEVYLYRAATGRLICASCNPSGVRPAGRDLSAGSEPFWMAAKLPNIENELYAQRVLSDNGRRLFFESFDSLVRSDTNGKEDVYQWEAPGSGTCTTQSPSFSAQDEGCVDLISSGESPQDSELLDASPSGNDVFIRTGSSLVPQDPGLFDVYDARAEGGFAPPPGPRPPCEGEACQSPPGPPAQITPASAVFQGAGNPAPNKQAKKQKKHHKRKHRQQKHKRGRQG
jgi:hypothetical protein